MTIKCYANDKLYLQQNNNISYYQTLDVPYNWATYTFIRIEQAMALSKIQAESMNLADTYAFTGTVSGTSGMTLLETRNDTSDVDYASDTTIFNFDSHTSTFHTFFFSWSLYLNGNGNCHCYLAIGDASNTKLNMRTIGHGKIDDGNDAMPASGSGSYHRWAFRAAGPRL